ncbi:MAG: polysaccharide biosynthesis tyrosine autokinase, partial [Planctomycetota bacterium]
SQHFFRAILEHKWTLLAVTLLVSVPIITAIWTLVAPKYEAKAKVRVRPIIPRLVFRTDENGKIPLYEGYMKTQMSIIRSPAALQKVLDYPEVQGTDWYDQPDQFWRISPRSRLERLLSDLHVQRQRGTELINVSINTLERIDGAVIVNAVLDQYIEYFNSRSDEGINRLFKELVEQFDTLTKEIEHQEKIVGSLRKKLGTSDPEQLVAKRRVRLDETEAELSSRRRILATARWRQNELQKKLKIKDTPTDQPPEKLDLSPVYRGDPEWRRLHREVLFARHKLEVEGGQLGNAHPQKLALLKNVGFAEHLLRQHEALLDEQRQLNPAMAPSNVKGQLEAESWQVHLLTYAPHSLAQELRSSYAPRSLGQELGAVNWQVKLLGFEEKLLIEDIAKQRTTWEEAFENAEVFAKELQTLNQKRQLHEAVRIRLEQKSLERNVPGAIEILARAITPTAPTRDRRLILTILGLFAGLGAGVSSAFLRSRADPPIYQVDEVTLPTAVPFLGWLPQVPKRWNCSPLDNPLVNEGIRMVRTPLLRRIDAKQGNVVLVTSPGPGEGKTTIAVMLARSLAQCGRNVLLVDADMRNPGVSEKLGIYTKTGFMEALTDGADDDQLIVRTAVSRLSVLPAGPLDNEIDLERITNGAFSAAAARWRKKYDVVLLDSPPVLPVADARILAREADGTILVLWAERTRRADAIESIAYLDMAGGKMWGTVLVGTLRRRHYGYAHNYVYGGVR